jgi:hypothetical protein
MISQLLQLLIGGLQILNSFLQFLTHKLNEVNYVVSDLVVVFFEVKFVVFVFEVFLRDGVIGDNLFVVHGRGYVFVQLKNVVQIVF